MLTLFLFGCSEKDNQTDPLKALGDSSSTFEQPAKTNKISFPQAHAPHKTYQQEWWYITANLKTEDGQSLATQWTLFRRGVEDKHWYFAHAALADKNQHMTAYRDGREELGNVSITTQPFAARIDDWLWQSNASFLPAQLTYGSQNIQDDNLQDNSLSAWQVQLELSNQTQFFLQGEAGFSQKHQRLNIASHYYSQPFIDVSGQVYWQGKWQKVNGKAWLDREWGSQMLAPDQEGWDWFSLRLNEETALMVYQIRSTESDYLYGSLMKNDGTIKTLSANDITVTQHDTKLFSSDVYPQSFIISIPEEQIDIAVNVVNKDQIMRFGIEYFEGMVTFSGSHAGEGFLEMTGYK